MKRTCLILASLTAIILLSCSSLENSNSSGEDLNFSRTLKKISPINEEQNPYAVPLPKICVSGAGSMRVINIPVGSTATSSQVCFNFGNLPAGMTSTGYDFTCTSTNAVGTFAITSATVTCGNYVQNVPWNGNGTITATAFAGMPANLICCVSYTGRCIGSPVGGGGCNYNMYNCTGCQ